MRVACSYSSAPEVKNFHLSYFGIMSEGGGGGGLLPFF